MEFATFFGAPASGPAPAMAAASGPAQDAAPGDSGFGARLDGLVDSTGEPGASGPPRRPAGDEAAPATGAASGAKVVATPTPFANWVVPPAADAVARAVESGEGGTTGKKATDAGAPASPEGPVPASADPIPVAVAVAVGVETPAV